jgi:hypothetical protein
MTEPITIRGMIRIRISRQGQGLDQLSLKRGGNPGGCSTLTVRR